MSEPVALSSMLHGLTKPNEDESRFNAVSDIGRPVWMVGESMEHWTERLCTWEETPQGQAEVKRMRDEMAGVKRYERERRAEVAATRSGIPEEVVKLVKSDKLFDTYVLQEIRNKTFTILVLSGETGTGKSVAAAWWLMQPYLKDGSGNVSIMWISATKLSRWSRYDDTQMDRLLKVNRLVIDDLGTEYADKKGNFAVTLDEVVNERSEYKRPTVFTTNLNAAGFTGRYDKRVVDRMRKYGRFVEFTGESMRKRT